LRPEVTDFVLARDIGVGIRICVAVGVDIRIDIGVDIGVDVGIDVSVCVAVTVHVGVRIYIGIDVSITIGVDHGSLGAGPEQRRSEYQPPQMPRSLHDKVHLYGEL